jgi:hypothetical protein
MSCAVIRGLAGSKANTIVLLQMAILLLHYAGTRMHSTYVTRRTRLHYTANFHIPLEVKHSKTTFFLGNSQLTGIFFLNELY